MHGCRRMVPEMSPGPPFTAALSSVHDDHLPMRKEEQDQEVCTQGHEASKFCNQDLNRGSLVPEKRRWGRGLTTFLWFSRKCGREDFQETKAQDAYENSDMVKRPWSEQAATRHSRLSSERSSTPCEPVKTARVGNSTERGTWEPSV